MFSFLLIMLVVAFTLTVMLIAGSLFFQNYVYTEASPGLFWQAPIVGGVMTGFLAFWCLLNAGSDSATAAAVPYDTIFRATGSVEMVDEPVPHLWVVREGQEQPIKYVRRKFVEGSIQKIEYVEEGSNRPWRHPEGIQAILIEHDGEKIRFEPRIYSQTEHYRYFVSPEGWSMPEYERGVTGEPAAYHYGVLAAVVFLNSFHLALWIVGLWLVLRFQFWHAAGLGLIIWLVLTIFVIPNLFTQTLIAGVLR